MDFGLTEEQKMVQDMARNFAEKEIAPFVEEDEENHYYGILDIHSILNEGIE